MPDLLALSLWNSAFLLEDFLGNTDVITHLYISLNQYGQENVFTEHENALLPSTPHLEVFTL